MQRTKHLLAAAATALALTVVAAPAAAETLTVAWDMSPEPQVVGYFVHIGTESGVYTQRIDVGNTTTYVLTTAVIGQQYCFAVSAYFTGPVEGGRSPEACTSGNLRPTLTNPGDQSHALGAPASLTLTAIDPEGAALTFSASGLPPGLSLATATGAITGAPTQAGTFAVSASVSDSASSDSVSFNWTITSSVPAAPTLRSPAGSIATTTPIFEWDPVASATRYRLWVDDNSETNPRVQVDLTPAQAGCSTSGAICRHNPGIALAAGPGSWSVRASNAVGDGPWSGARDFSVSDGRAPVVTILTPTSATTHSTGGTTLAIGGSATDDVGVVQVTWSNDRGGAGSATGTSPEGTSATSASSWSVAAVPLSQGTNVITVTARDAAGLTATDTLTVTRTDTGAPTVTISTPTTAATHSTTEFLMAVGGTATDDVGVTAVTWVSDRGGSGTASGTGTWSIAAVDLRGGANTITVTARDASGRTGTDVIVITRTDDQRPVVTISSPSAADTHSTGTPTLTLGGTATDNFTITQVTWTNSRGGGGTATGTTAWSASNIALQAGSNVLTVTARDSSGNLGTDTITVNLTDNTAPTVSIAVPTTAATYTTQNASVPLGGTATDSNGVTEVRWASDRGVSGVATGTTAWTVASVALSPGANVITVTARDAAGLTATDTLTVTRADAGAPVVTISTPTTAATHSTTQFLMAVGGTATDDVGVTAVTWVSDRGGSGTASGTGTWSIAAVDLRGGANTITVTARDASGRTGTDVIVITRTDDQRPVVTISSPSAADTHSTGTPTLTLGGTATDNFTITQVTWTNSRGGGGTATGTTAWSASNIALQAGSNVLTVTARDSSGNLGTDTVTVNLTDNTRPTVTIVTPTAATRYTTAATTVALGGTAADDSGVASVTWTNDRGGNGSATGTTAWSIASVALQSGVNTITVTATDRGGSTATAALRVVSDGRNPTVTIAQPVATPTHAVNTATVNLGGAASDDQGVTEVSWSSNRGRRGVAAGTSSWTAPGVALDAGINVLTVTARDEVGNTSSATLTVVLDARGPGITIETPTTNSTTATNVGTIALSGTANDDVGVTQVTWANDRGGSGSATGVTAWAVPLVALQAGANVLTVTARDAAGNVSTDTLAVHYDTRAPAVTIAAPTAAGTFATTSTALALAGAATDDGVVTEVRWANSRGGSGVATGTNRWTVERAALQLGANEITITARDAAGNSASTRLVVTATDRQAPAIRITGPSVSDTFTTSARLINLDGTATDDFGVTQIAWASDRGTSGVARGTGSWIAGGIALLPGVNVIAVTALDAAGNSSSDVLRITVDGQIPVVSITSPGASPYNSATQTVVVSGTASDDAGITQVLWASDRGQGGAALGTTTWTTPAIPLESGTNVVVITARDLSGNTTTATLTVVYRDSAAPAVTIGTPTAGQTFTTAAPAINLGGTASDNFGVAQVSWSNDRGGTGIAFGTTGWSIAAVPLAEGLNVITVTARDAAGLTGTAALRVTRSSTTVKQVAGTSTPATSEPAPALSQVTAGTSALTAQSAQSTTGQTLGAPIPDGRIPTGYPTALSPQPLASPVATSPAPASSPAARPRPIAERTDATQESQPNRQPVVTISVPSATDELVTRDATVTLAGTSRDAIVVTWSTNHGASGTAVGRDRWSVTNFGLPLGKTIVTITARNAVGDLASDTLTVTRQPANVLQLGITSPTADSAWDTASSTVALRGLASDNVVRVTWQADWGGTGTASGTRTWTIPTIGLQIGVNRITVTAHDAEGQTQREVISVTYRPLSASSR